VGKLKYLPQGEPGLVFTRMDILNTVELRSVVRSSNFQVVYHLARTTIFRSAALTLGHPPAVTCMALQQFPRGLV